MLSVRRLDGTGPYIYLRSAAIGIMEVFCQIYYRDRKATFVPLPNIVILPEWPKFFDERWLSSLLKKIKIFWSAISV